MLGTTKTIDVSLPNESYLVTGAAGFIGAQLCLTLLQNGRQVVGVDNFSPYYDPTLKRDRVNRLLGRPGFELIEQDLADSKAAVDLFRGCRPEAVIHLAAQPGVAHSTTDPLAYVQSNVVGMMNVLEGCRLSEVKHLVYASSSSVYEAQAPLPWSIDAPAGHPVSVYAATKRSNELMAHSYSHLFGLPTTGLRFFTAYGPWGRPDMAYYKFALKMASREPITIYGDGSQLRDFTYIDDIVEAVVEACDQIPPPAAQASSDTDVNPGTPYRLFNLGHGEPVSINRIIELLEENLGVEAIPRRQSPRRADLPATRAEVGELRETVGFSPSTPVEVGVKEFARWFLNYHY
ncbi:MAG: NAD-dependent epimerase/dehydratase family protein [Actinobacteria bacterium]|nr:NAD-dependent epimerase/dehydratase family protein [Actinomycetota bacterium]